MMLFCMVTLRGELIEKTMRVDKGEKKGNLMVVYVAMVRCTGT